MGLFDWLTRKSEREEVSFAPSFNARSLVRAARKALRDNKHVLRDLKNIEGDTTRKDLAKMLRDLRKFEKDTAHFEEDMKTIQIAESKEGRIGINQMQAVEDILKYLKKIGVPPAVIGNEKKFLDTLLAHWEEDIRGQLRRAEDELKEVQALRSQNRAA